MRPSRAWINTSIYLVTALLSSLLGLLTALLMTKLLTPSEFGRIGIFISILYLLVPMVSLAAEGLIAVNLTTLDAEEYERFRRTTVAIGFSVFLILQAIGFTLWGFHLLRDEILLLLPIFALLRLVSTMASTEYIVEGSAIKYSMLTLLNSVLVLILTYGMMVWISASAGSRIAALMVAELVLVLARYHGRAGLLFRPAFDLRYRKQILMFGVPSLMALFGAWGLNESDKLIVAHGVNISAAGIYTAAAALAVVMMNFIQALTNALLPELFKRLSEKLESLDVLMVRYMVKFAIISGAFGILIITIYALIGDSLLPTKYASASIYFYGLVVASIAVAIFRPLGLIAEYLKIARLRAIAIIAGGAITIIISSAGIKLSGNPLWAAVGVALGYLVASGIIFLYLHWMSKK